jgi:hypothetical protein
MNELFPNYESYILNEANMQSYLKYILTKDDTKVNKKDDALIKKTKHESYVKIPSIFIPREHDSLFWCYYIIKYGDIEYEMKPNRNIITSKQIKINLISKIRENKLIVKTYKFDTLTNLENNLANDATVSIKTILTLCAIENINIIFIKKKTYFELITNDSEDIYIIREMDSVKLKYNKIYGYEMSTGEMLHDIRSNLYKVTTLNIPIKSISSYKVSELVDIANKLAIEIKKDTGKNKTKSELYELIVQYLD